MAAAALGKIGVQAVVAGLSSFLGDMGKVDSSIKKLISPTNILGGTFSWLGGVVSGVVGGALRTLEYALGSLLASAIQSVVKWLKEMGAGVLESADSFQKLEIRLQRLNFNTLRDSGLEYNDAMTEAIRLTKEQIDWTIRLGAQTPYDAKDIADIYTLARGYGFTAEEAKGLTESVVDFTAGMGLTNVELERVIVNFGQLRQQGKLNSQDLRDLARGAFVPINKILEITAEKLDITVEEFNKLKQAGKLTGDAVDIFRQSFEEFVGANFEGAAIALGNVFSVARQNVEGLIRDMLGMYVVGPVLFTIGSYVQSLTDTITDNDERWNILTESLKRIGASAVNIINRILEMSATGEEFADAFVEGLDNIASWLETNEDAIVQWVQDAVKWLKDELLPAITQVWGWLFGTSAEEGAIQKFGAWLKNDLVPWVEGTAMPIFRDLIDLLTGKFEVENAESPLAGVIDIIAAITENLPVAKELLGAFGEVIQAAFGGDEPKTFAEFIRDTVVPALYDLAAWVRENKEGLALLLKGFLALEIIGFVVGLFASLIGIVAATGAAIVTLAAIVFTPFKLIISLVSTLVTGFQWLGALLMTSTATAFGVFIAAVAGLIVQFKFLEFQIRMAVGAAKILVDGFTSHFNALLTNVKTTISQALDAIRNGDWLGAGAAIIRGMVNGIMINASSLINTLVQLAKNAIAAAKATLGIKSPSTVFFGIGEQLMLGFAEGITEASRMAVKAMQGASAAVTIPALQSAQIAMSAMPTNSVTNNTSNQYNLNIHTSAPTENIIQDFDMLASLSG